MSEELEAKCKRCGICCHYKLKINGVIYIFMNEPCSYLKKEDGVATCNTYETRLNTDVSCINLENAIKEQILPYECGYRDMFPRGYIYPVQVNSLKDIRT